MTLHTNALQLCWVSHFIYSYAVCHCAGVIMLKVVMLSIIMLIAFMLTIIMLSVIMLSVIMLMPLCWVSYCLCCYAECHNAIVVMISVIMMSVIMMSAIMMSVMATSPLWSVAFLKTVTFRIFWDLSFQLVPKFASQIAPILRRPNKSCQGPNVIKLFASVIHVIC
jgi:hypothetical protein